MSVSSTIIFVGENSLSIERQFLASSPGITKTSPTDTEKFMFYSAVLLDGKELQNLSLEQVKELFFKRQINQNSLVCSNENPNWQMLKRTFDLSQWISTAAPQVPVINNNFPPANNPFAPTQTNSFQPPVSQPAAAHQPVTFNQFPTAPTVQPTNSYAPNASNGYSQNNQTETYYQAETNQTNYNFQNNQSNFAPSKYSNPANSYNYTPDFIKPAETRSGAKQAAIFILINAFFYIISNIVASYFAPGGSTEEAERVGQGVGKSFIPLIIDLILAVKLWKLDDVESARKWVLVRAYLGFIVFGIVFPFISLNAGEIFVGVFSFVTGFFYFISLTLVLHGKENPSQSRVIIGMGTFAIYFLVMFGTISLTVVGNVAPNMAKFDTQKSEVEKYKIEGKEFQDKTTGAKVVLPEGWSMLKLDNPVIHSPEARMIAVDKAGNRLTMLEVVPVPGNLDMKRQNSTFILDQLADGVVQALKEEVSNSGGFGGKNSLNEITRMSIFIGKHPAKLMVFDKSTGGLKAKGHLIITYDELTFYVLHSWCPAEEYDQAQNDFTFFEKNFTVPEKINSTFTQSAENDKKR